MAPGETLALADSDLVTKAGGGPSWLIVVSGHGATAPPGASSGHADLRQPLPSTPERDDRSWTPGDLQRSTTAMSRQTSRTRWRYYRWERPSLTTCIFPMAPTLSRSRRSPPGLCPGHRPGSPGGAAAGHSLRNRDQPDEVSPGHEPESLDARPGDHRPGRIAGRPMGFARSCCSTVTAATT